MTNVNFRFLDTTQIKPLGIYGSRSEIVKYLQDVSAIDDEASVVFIQPCNYTALTSLIF